jgi:flagellin
MGMTINNLNTLSLLNILTKTSNAQDNVMQRMATGSRINRGADDPAGLISVTKLSAELVSVNAAIGSNQRTDTVLGVADTALSQVGSLLSDIQRLASETANDAALTSEEKVANQSQIDDALVSIDRIIGGTQFNGKKLLDGSLGINFSTDATKITDVRVYSRKSGSTDTTLNVKMAAAASYATVSQVMVTSAAAAINFSVQGKTGTAVITLATGDKVSAAAYKINQTKSQTGLSASVNASNTNLQIYSTAYGADAFVRTKLLEGTGTSDKNDTGADAKITVNGQQAAVDGNTVSFIGASTSATFEIATAFAVGDTVTLTVNGSGGATFQLGTNANTLATIGIDGMQSAMLGNKAGGYLSSLASGGTNSVLTDPSTAAQIAATAQRQVSQLQGRIGGFQKFQVRTTLASLNDVKQGLEKARSVINDVDYAVEAAELNKQNILLQSAMSLLGLANQQSSQVLSLLR